MSAFDPALLKFLAPAIASGIMLRRFGGTRWLEDIRRAPSLRHAAAFGAVYLGWMLFTDLLLDWRGPWDFEPWLDASTAHSLWRLLGVCIAGPLLEELVFRGVLLGWLADRGWRPAIAVTAASGAWSVIHVDYSAAVIGVIFVAGLVLGAARLRSRSLLLPYGLHAVWNLYAIW